MWNLHKLLKTLDTTRVTRGRDESRSESRDEASTASECCVGSDKHPKQLGEAANARACEHQQMHGEDKDKIAHAISSDEFFKAVRERAAAEGKRTLNIQVKATSFTLNTDI